jgi:WD40 repeat protein
MKRVFISYSRRNKTFAERLARDLSDAGLEVWVDFRQIQGGELWQNEIFRGIERAEMVVFCMSPDSVMSEWCRREVLTARQQGKYIIPVMVVNAVDALRQREDMQWLLDVHFINFEGRYEAAFPELLEALPGARRVGVYDDVAPEHIPNPFKGLEAFQQTDAQFFFGREELIAKSLKRLREDRKTRFLAVVGASGSGKSSLVRAGIIPKIRAGELPNSDTWPVVIFTPGEHPIDSLATRLLPLLGVERDVADVARALGQPENLNRLVEAILVNVPADAHLVMVVDQFEEVFTRAGQLEREAFLKAMYHAVTVQGGRAVVIITMRADFFGRLSEFPNLAELFEQENMIIVTEMTPADLLRTIEGPAQAVGLVYDEGLPARILEDVRRQPGSLPLLQYALKQLYERREGRRLTMAAYEAMGGVKQALARHAESIYVRLNAAQQGISRRLLLQLVEVTETGETTRRRVNRTDLTFRGIADDAVQEVIDLLTAPESRLLIASREIKSSADESQPTIWIEVGHEALIREWDRFKGWVAENVEALRFGSEILKAAQDWNQSGRDPAYLLTGNRLARADIWIETADASNLQREFIQASEEERKRREAVRQEQQARELELQRKAARRLRNFVVVLVVSLVVAIALTLFAFQSLALADAATQREKEAAEEASRAADEAQSLALSAIADRSLLDGNTELALTLAVEAVQLTNPPPQAQFTLANVAYAPGVRRRLTDANSAITAIAYTSDGRYALAGLADNTLVMWDLSTVQQIRRLEGHSASVTSVAVSPDGRTVVSGSQDATLIMWDVSAGAIIRRMSVDGNGHTGHILAVAFSPDGSKILSGSLDMTAIVWDAATGAQIRQFPGHTEPVTAVGFSPDSTRALTGTRTGNLILWDAQSGSIIRTFIGEEKATPSGIIAVGFNTAGDQVLSASSDAEVVTWNVATGQPEATFTATFGEVSLTSSSFTAADEGEQTVSDLSAAVFSDDGAFILTGTPDSRIDVWNVETEELVLAFRAGSGVVSGTHTGRITALDFSPDGRNVLSGSDDKVAIVWDTQRAEQIRTFPLEGNRVNAVAFSPDGRTIISGSTSTATSASPLPINITGEMRSWDVETGRTIQEFRGHEQQVFSIAYSPDGSKILSGDGGGSIILWDANRGTQILTFEGGHTRTVYALAFTPDGSRALSASRDETLILWDVTLGQPIGQPFTGHDGPVFTLAMSPDGRTALSGGADNVIILWDLETGQEIQRYQKHEKDVRSVAFSPDGKSAVSGASDGSLILWDVESGADIIAFSGHRSSVNSTAFSPDGRSILSGSLDGTISLWDIASGFEIRRYPVSGGNGVLSLAFSPDGHTVVSGLSGRVDTLRLWRVLPQVQQVLDWTFANRFVPELECSQRQQFRIEPQCADGIIPVRTPYPLPTSTPVSDDGRLVVGKQATVNTTLGNLLNLREQPNINAYVITQLNLGTVVTLLEGPTFADKLNWWRVQTPDGREGWVVESVENIQTLLPQP